LCRDSLSKSATVSARFSVTEPLPTPEQDPSTVPVTYVHAAAADFFTETVQKAATTGADIVTWPDAARCPHVQHPRRVAGVLLNLPR